MRSPTAKNPVPSQKFSFLTKNIAQDQFPHSKHCLRKPSRGRWGSVGVGGTKQERDQHGQVWKSRGAPLIPAVGHGMGMEGGWEQELGPGTEEMSPWALIEEVGWGGWLHPVHGGEV